MSQESAIQTELISPQDMVTGLVHMTRELLRSPGASTDQFRDAPSVYYAKDQGGVRISLLTSSGDQLSFSQSPDGRLTSVIFVPPADRLPYPRTELRCEVSALNGDTGLTGERINVDIIISGNDQGVQETGSRFVGRAHWNEVVASTSEQKDYFSFFSAPGKADDCETALQELTHVVERVTGKSVS